MVDASLLNTLFKKLKSKKALLVFAESLTGGLISSEFSKIPGSSSVLWGAYVAYSIYAKEKCLHVPKEVITTYGVVSEECALEMAKGVLSVSHSKENPSPIYSLAVTGLAGPATKEDLVKVGTVYIAAAKIEKISYIDLLSTPIFDISSVSKVFYFNGDRNSVREQTLNSGIELLLNILE
ncbi:MAG: CinA family protein [Treponema sp.]